MSGWPEVALGDVLRRADRFEAKDELAEYEFAGTYSFARGIFRGETKTGSTFRLPIIQRVHAGDFIYCKIMAWEGAFGVAPPDVDGCVLSGAYVVYEIDATKLDPSYIDWYFKQRTVWESIGGRSTGTNVRRRSLHPDVFEAFQMPLPPIEEQRRAVAALDGVLIRLDRAMRLHDWVSSKPGTLVGAVVHDLIANREAAENSHASLGDFVVDAAYGTSERCDSDPTGIPVLRMGNIQDSEVLIRDLKYLPETAASPDLLRRGDILVNRTNSAELVGKCAVFDLEGNWTFASYLVRLRLDMSRANPWLVASIINSPIGRAYVHRERTQMTGQANINARKLLAMPMPLPSSEDQDKIVRRLARTTTLVGRLVGAQKQRAEAAERLRLSVVTAVLQAAPAV